MGLYKRLAALCCIVAALVTIPLLPVPEYWITLANYIGLYTLPALGLVLLTGVAGLTSFGQATFVGTGAYATALLSLRYGVSPWLGLPLGILLTVSVAWVIGRVTLRISGHYLSLATMAWSLCALYFVGNFDWMGGYDGLSGIPVLAIGSVDFGSGRKMFFLIWLAVAIAMLSTANLLSSRQGRALRALRAGPVMAPAMGIDTARSKMTAFVLAAVFASVSGWLYAHLQRAINPTPFGLNYGIEYLLMAVVGGAGHIGGAVAGAVVVTLLRELLTDALPAFFGSHANLEAIVFGVLLIVILQRMPRGLWPALVRRAASARHTTAVGDGPPLIRRTRNRAGDDVPLLQVLGLKRNFGGLTAVDDMSLTVHAGEVVALIGPNGAGKSTTFNLISGADSLGGGVVTFCGKALRRFSARDMARQGMSRTFQHVQLLAEMSVIENVALGAHSRRGLRADGGVFSSMLRLNRDEERRIFVEARVQLQRVGLDHVADEAAGSLSLGQQRLLEIARALCSDPTLLLLDEPAAGLRLKEKEALSVLLNQLRADGLGVLIVEHDMDFLMNIADRVVVMEFGRKIAEGRPAEVRNDPEVRRAYLGLEDHEAVATRA